MRPAASYNSYAVVIDVRLLMQRFLDLGVVRPANTIVSFVCESWALHLLKTTGMQSRLVHALAADHTD